MKPWNLNPYIQFNGHFKIPKEAVDSSEKLEVEITVTYFDENDVEKKLLPTKFVYMRDKDNWYSEPS